MNPPVSTAPAKTRLLSLDAARVLATFAIVWVHVAESHGQSLSWTALGRFGTSFYVVVAALFVVRSADKSTPRLFTEELRSRTRRLLRPFLVWSLIYGAVSASIGLSAGASIVAITEWWGPLAGTQIHLWFLPFVFFWGLVATFATPHISRLKDETLLIGGALVCAGTYWLCYGWLNTTLSRPWLWAYHLHRLDRWLDEIPPFFTAIWGAVVVSRWRVSLTAFLEKSRALLIALLVLGFVLVEVIYAREVLAIKATTLSEGRFMANAAALLLLLSFVAIERGALVRFLAPWGRYTYVAFLSHMLVLELIGDLLSQLPGAGGLWLSLVSSVVIFAVSLGASWLISTRPSLALLRA